MRILNLTINNFQSYDEANIDFEEGVTLIHGDNGSGKSSILRAIFGALYQTKVTNETSADYDLADFVNNDEDEAEVSLTFESGGNEYTIEWVIRVSEDDDGERKGSTKSCTLTSPALPGPEEGVTAVRPRVSALLGMEATEFANSVYVQQKRFTRLLNATDSERRKMLDGLLGLNSLDEYVERMKLSRRPVKRKRNAAKNRRKEVQSRIDDVDEDALKRRKQRLSSEISDLENQRESLQADIREWQRRADRIGDDIESHKEKAERKQAIENKIEEKQETVGSLNKEGSEWNEEIEELEAEIEALRDDIESVETETGRTLESPDDADRFVDDCENTKTAAFQTLEQKKNEVSRLIEKIEGTKSDKLAPLEAELGELRDELSVAQTRLDEKQTELQTEREKRQEKTQEYLDTDSLPEAPRDAVVELKDEADGRREALGQEITRVDAERVQSEEAIPALRDELDEAEQTLTALEESVGNADDASTQFQEALDKAKEHADSLGITIDRESVLETLGGAVPDVHDSTLSSYHELTKAAIDDGSLSREVERELDKMSEISDVTRALARAAQYQQLVTAADRVEALEEEISEHKETISEAEERKERLEEKRDEQQQVVQTGDLLLELFDDVETLEDEVTTIEETVDDHAEEIDEIKTEIATVEAEIETLEEEHETAVNERDEAKEAFSKAEARLDLAEEASDAFDEIERKETGIQNRKEKISAHTDRIESLSDEINELREEKQSIVAELEGSPSLDEKKMMQKKAEENVDSLNEEEETVSNELKEKNEALNSTKKDLESLRNDKQRKQELDQKVNEANALIEDLTEIIDTYESVKVELREETLGLLNTYTNDVFDELYQNESYRGIRIDQDYNVELVRSDGTRFDPNKGSGGEGVIVNIALRAGVYRTIAEREDTNGASLPPFILDEPTNHLDNAHVGKLEDIIGSIQDWDVPQVFIVTHRDAMMTKADHELHVEKDDTTDRSTATLTSK